MFGDPPELVQRLPETQLPEGAVAANVIDAVPMVMVGLPVPATDKCGFDEFVLGGVPAVAEPLKSATPYPGPTPLPISP